MSTETKPSYSPGLAGVVAGETEICWVDPNAGLMYRGYDIHEMGDKATFEEVAYLLLNGELPNGKQLNEFRQQIDSADRKSNDVDDGRIPHRARRETVAGKTRAQSGGELFLQT